jgi:kynurenine formamidase
MERMKRRLGANGRGNMKNSGTIVTLSLALLSVAAAQDWKPPLDTERCPSRWGSSDERGSMNNQTPDLVLKSARAIRTGELIELGRVLSDAMPMPTGRSFQLYTKRTFMNAPPNHRGSNEELVVTELGQVGTQFDGFVHQTIGDSTYNCFKVDDIASRSGFTKLGVEKVGMIFTRGVLVDIAALKGVKMLGDSYEIRADDLQQALIHQNISLQPGDAVLIYTGWGQLWEKDNARYLRSNPGIGVTAAQWLAKQSPTLVGSDNGPVEVSPNPDTRLSLPVHQIMLVVNGIHLLENLKLDEMAAKQVHEFAFAMQPLKIKGGTGSTVAPVAIR